MIATVLEQHLEEAAFLSGLRQQAIHEPHYDLNHLTTLDNRIEAHLDGLRIAGPVAIERLLEQLSPNAEGEVFAATVLAFETANTAAMARLAEHVRGFPDSADYMAAALGWLDWARVEPWLEKLLGSADALFRQVGLAACGMHRRDPGPALIAGLAHAQPSVIAQAARTAGELRRRDLMPAIRAHRLHVDEGVRFWANWATLQMGDEEALLPLRQFAEQTGRYQYRGLPALLAWQPRDVSMAWVRQAMQQPQQRRMVIQAVGLLGEAASIPWLIQQMRDIPNARAGGEAFSLITGADLALLDLELRDTPEHDAGPNDDPADPNVALDADENLPWPDPTLVEEWWQRESRSYQSGKGYFLGQPISEQGYWQALAKAQQRQRWVAASGLARLRPTDVLFPVAAPAWRQRVLLNG